MIMKMFKKLASLLLILCLCGCSAKEDSSTVRYYYSYTIYPVGYLLNRIGGNRINTTSVQTSNIVQNASVVDNFSEILNNSIYFYCINGLEPYLDVYGKTITNSKVNVVDLGKSSIYPFKRFTPVNSNGTRTFIESDYYDGDVFQYVDTYNDDLFLWLDPIGMLSMAKDIYTNLSSNYAEASNYFENNFTSLENDLIALDASYQNLATKLTSEGKSIKFVSMTPSFGSWQKAYGIEVYPVCLSKYGALPTDSQLQIIKERIIKDGVRYIAYEPNMSPDMMNLFMSLEEELGLLRVNLSNISSLTVTQLADSKDYLTIMYENLSVLENIATNKYENTAQEVIPEEGVVETIEEY